MTHEEAKAIRDAFERMNPGAVKQEESDLRQGYSAHAYTAHDLWAVFAEGWEAAAQWVLCSERMPGHLDVVLVDGGPARYIEPSGASNSGKWVALVESPHRYIQWEVKRWAPIIYPRGLGRLERHDHGSSATDGRASQGAGRIHHHVASDPQRLGTASGRHGADRRELREHARGAERDHSVGREASALGKVAAVMNWITCSEQLPDERVLVLYLVRDDDEPRLGMRKKLGEQWYWCESAGFDGDYEHTVTHWLPIPALPQP